MSTEKVNSRTFTGCWACRFKKRRCDERKPHCSLCLLHGDKCCYDVRLIWQNENIFSVNQTNELVSWKKLKKLCKKPGKNRISKQEFCRMTQFRELSPPNSEDESAENDEINSKIYDTEFQELDRARSSSSSNESCETDEKPTSFTISVRRLKLYENALDCVHGKTYKEYGQKHVNKQLSELLTTLEEKSRKCGCSDCGPFHVFKASAPPTREFPKPAKLASTPLHSQKSDSGCSISSSLPNTPLSQSSSTRTSISEGTSKFLANHWPLMLQNNHSNFCLQQPAYVDWLTGRVENVIHSINPELLEELMHQKLNASKWLPVVPQFSMECQTMYLLLIVLADISNNYVDYISRWILAQTSIPYLSFPLVTYALSHNTSITFLIHCHELLSEAGLQDLFQYDLTSMLKINTVRLILQHWNNVMMDQICECRDTTHAEMQLKFWELQLQCNEEFYRDICLV
ncbi:LAME_0C08020g1_1 [Lachancea meyersii CBS 8951]|uniref:LAME_0C08020g1_1 n=1 Tax=Lachancea meyersii CBS 8951 TaxID=1266667 RepID=A0A1G4J344_9SACH|nr:LAME_0C08020g1_1 [Lachancea meyersii CBS 8951]